MITDMINLILLDTGNEQYINNFTIRMLAPTTQEEIDRRENIVGKIGLISDVMNNLGDIENSETKLKILKDLLSNAINNPDVIQLIEDEIESIETSKIAMEAPQEEAAPDTKPSEVSTDLDALFNSDEPLDLSDNSEPSDLTALFAEPEAAAESETSLPNPEELGIGDVSDSTNPNFD